MPTVVRHYAEWQNGAEHAYSLFVSNYCARKGGSGVGSGGPKKVGPPRGRGRLPKASLSRGEGRGDLGLGKMEERGRGGRKERGLRI